MRKDYNLYDCQVLAEEAKRVRQFDTSIRIKAQHKSRVYKVKELLESLEHINRYIFDPEYFYSFYRYKESVELGRKKTDLDNLLKSVIENIVKELNSMADIEMQTLDGRLVRNPTEGSNF